MKAAVVYEAGVPIGAVVKVEDGHNARGVVVF